MNKSDTQQKNNNKSGYLNRFLTALLPVLLPVFMYVLFGPLEIIMGNTDYIKFHFVDIIWILLAVTLVITVTVAAICAIFKGKILSIILSAFTGFGLMSYINGNFLNKYLGTLNGIEPLWSEYATHSNLNIAICTAIFLIPIVICLISKKDIKKLLICVSGILVAMQLVAMVTSMIQQEKATSEKAYLTLEDQFELAGEGNVVIFLLDALSNKAIEEMVQLYPDALNSFSDFTYYNNNNTLYVGTFPSTTYLLTGHEYDFKKSYRDFFRDAWTSEKAELFYQTLKDNGYEFNLYDETPYIANPATLMEGKISNLKVAETVVTVDYNKVPRLFKLSAYRYMPFAFKKHFFLDTSDLNEIVAYSNDADHQGAIKLRVNYLDELQKMGLTVDKEDKNRVTLQYLWGAHPPYSVTAEGEYCGKSGGSTLGAQTKGYMHMVEVYIQKMKELGIYDDSTIIVMSDHGDLEVGDVNADVQAVFMLKKPNEKHESIIISKAPISHENFMPTMIRLTGGEPEAFGETIFEVNEDDTRERRTYRWMVNSDYPDLKRKYNVMQEYRYTGGREELKQQFINGPYEIHPLLDSFY